MVGRFEQELPCLGFSFTELVIYNIYVCIPGCSIYICVSLYPQPPPPPPLLPPPSPNHPSAQIMNKYIVQLFVSFHSIIVMLLVAKQAETQACGGCVKSQGVCVYIFLRMRACMRVRKVLTTGCVTVHSCGCVRLPQSVHKYARMHMQSCVPA